MRLHLEILDTALAVARLDANASLPAWFDFRALPAASVTRTAAETSILFPETLIPPDVRAERGWRAVRVEGPLDFAGNRVLNSLLVLLSAAEISVVALSTFDTDYVLVRGADLPAAIATLRTDHDITRDGGALAYRRAAAADAPEIWAVTKISYAKWVPLIGREPLPATADYAIAVRDHVIDLIRIGGALAGLIEMIPGDGHLLVENVAVAPAFQGKGLGRNLMAHAEQVARSLRLPEMRLYTNKLFASNIGFYTHLGYQVAQETPFADGIVVHMRKPLSTWAVSGLTQAR